MNKSENKNSFRLFEGVRAFRENDFIHHSEVFKDLSDIQNPHTLFIGCSDSRVVPNLITSTLPGELFILRNIGNLVPYFEDRTDTYLATSAGIEYAVSVLGVENIIICGHSNCGGCSALYYDKERLEQLPQVSRWLSLARPVVEIVKQRTDITKKGPLRDWLTEQLNVVEQMNHLLSYPYLKEKYERGELTILGWYYVIETGEVYNYSPEKQVFERIE